MDRGAARRCRGAIVAVAVAGGCASNPSSGAGPPPVSGIASAADVGDTRPPSVEPAAIGPREGVSIDVRYPHLRAEDGASPTARAAFAAFDRAIDELREAEVATFVAAVREAARVAKTPEAFGLHRLEVRCEPTLLRATLVSVRCRHLAQRGGAHPSETSTALSFRLRGGKATRLALDDLFLPGKDHRRAISELCVADLERQKAAFVLSGMRSVEALLHTFNLKPTGLLVTFDPYEVGPGAEGFREVEVPWTRLCARLDPEGPAGELSEPPADSP